MSATGKTVGVTPQSVMRWLRKVFDKLITEKPDISEVKEVEMDEMYHFFQKQFKSFVYEKLLIIKAKTSSGELWNVVIPKP